MSIVSKTDTRRAFRESVLSPMTLRILHVIDTGGPGGAESVLLNIVEGLDRSRFQSRVIPPYEGWLQKRLAASELELAVVPRGPSPDLAFLSGLRRQIRAFRPHLIHTHLLTSSVYGSVAAGLEGDLPLVATFHGTPDVSDFDRFLFVKGRVLMRPRNRLVFVAEHLRRKLTERLGISLERSEVIHNGVALAPFDADPWTPRAASPITVGAVGNLRPAKDYPTLLKAARVVALRFPHVSFVVAGDGGEEEMRRLLALRDELGLSERFRFAGFVDDVLGFMKSLDVFVSSSGTEGLPLAIVQAAALGKPVCATRSGGAEEVLEPGGASLMARVHDPLALADRICWALDHPAEAGRIAALVAQDVHRRFAMGCMLERYSELYERMTRDV